MDFFEVERLRDYLISSGNLGDFRQTYDGSYSEIKNLNTGSKWDDENDLSKMTFRLNPMAHQRTQFAALNVLNSTTVLDIGSGPGNLEEFLLNKNVKVVGVDISKKSVGRAKELFSNYKFIHGDFLKVHNFGFNKFDCVVAMEVMEHISPSATFNFLKKVRGLLRRGGRFIVSVPLNEGLEQMVREGINPNAHVRVYTPAIIKTELSLFGFRLLKEKYLYAFHNHYRLKSWVMSVLRGLKTPNNIILISEKV